MTSTLTLLGVSFVVMLIIYAFAFLQGETAAKETLLKEAEQKGLGRWVVESDGQLVWRWTESFSR